MSADSEIGLLSLPFTAHLTGCHLFINLFDGVLNPVGQTSSSLLFLTFGVGLHLAQKGLEFSEILGSSFHARSQEDVDVARDGPRFGVDTVFDAVEELISESIDQVALSKLTETTAHFLHMLQAHVIRLLKDRHECLTLGLRVGVCRLTELFSATKHVRLIHLRQLSEALLLLVFSDVGSSEHFTNQRVAHLDVDFGSIDHLALGIIDFAKDKPLGNQGNLVLGGCKADST